MLRRPLFQVHLRQYSTGTIKGHTHFFAGSPLNRLAWLRTSPLFLNAVVGSSATRWILFNEGKPLMASAVAASGPSLARLTTTDVKPLLGAEPFFSQSEKEGVLADSSVASLQAARLRGPPIVFLGLHEHEDSSGSSHALPSSEFSAKEDVAAVVTKLHGTPYFSLDVSELEDGHVQETLRESVQGHEGVKLEFMDGRAAMGSLDQFESSVFAEARSLVDWSARNRYCAGCGSPVYTLWAGWKHACSSLLPWAEKRVKPCPTGKALNNHLHPRTDPVAIILTVNQTNDKILLGRNRNWPKNFYSALAGFVEPGESFEDTVERELWEEAGIRLLGIKYHSTQPWPFPANIMAGFYAVADSSEPVRIDLDNELEDARWYSREEVRSVLVHSEGVKAGKQAPKWDSGSEDRPEETEQTPTGDEPLFKVPPRNAMAGVLISDWAHGKVDVSEASAASLNRA